MNKYRWLVALIVLVLASLACQTVMGGGNEIPQAPQSPTNDNGGNGNDTIDPMPTEAPPVDNGGGGGTQNSGEFPMPTDATNVVTAQDTLIFETSLSVDEVVAFYRDEFGKLGLTERDSMTVTMGQLFTLVFDGDPSGKAISVSGADMGDGTTAVTIVKQDF
jgi:hypothetical protein